MEIKLEILILVFTFVMGACAGSFLNVLILRIPAGEGFVKGRSHCMNCGYTLTWYDMIPVASWLVYGGKCRKCGAKISAQYPLVELANAVLWTLTVGICGLDPRVIPHCLAISALIVISVIDFRTYEIPFGLNLFIGLCGLAVTVMDGMPGLISHVGGFFIISLPLFILFLISGGNAIGGGDVKLMAAAGLMLGTGSTVAAFLTGCLLGVVIHLIRMKVQGSGPKLALGPYLAAGIIISIWWGDLMVEGYLSLLGL